MPALIVVKILVFFLGLAVHSEFWIEVEADLLETWSSLFSFLKEFLR